MWSMYNSKGKVTVDGIFSNLVPIWMKAFGAGAGPDYVLEGNNNYYMSRNFPLAFLLDLVRSNLRANDSKANILPPKNWIQIVGS